VYEPIYVKISFRGVRKKHKHLWKNSHSVYRFTSNEHRSHDLDIVDSLLTKNAKRDEVTQPITWLIEMITKIRGNSGGKMHGNREIVAIRTVGIVGA